MTQFATECVIDVRLDERSLQQSGDKVRDELGSVEVSPTTSGGAMPSNSGRSTSSSMVSGSPSSAGGGKPWGEHIDLNERRNELLEDLKDSMDESSYDRASRMGSMGGGIALGGIALGVGALSNLLSSFSWPSLPELKKPGWLPPDLPQPGWLPLDPDPMPIEEPNSKYPVESPGSEYPVEEPGSEYPVEEPGTEYPLEEPGSEYPLEEPGSEYPLEEPQEEYPVEEPDPIQVDFGFPDVSGEQLLGGLLAGGGAIGGGLLGREFLKGGGKGILGGGPRASGGGFGIPAPSFLIGDRAAEAQRKDPDDRGFIDRKLAGLVEGLGGVGGSRMMLAGGGGGLADLAGPAARAALDANTDQSSTSRSNVEPERNQRRENVRVLADAIVKAINRKQLDANQSDSGSSDNVRNIFDTDVTVEAQGVSERELDRAMEKAKKEASREFNRQITGRRR
ncbi:hypothetical protein DJ71_14970 [Halorubrum sp. E3]|nr:hypothetical protein DJ71_14970 [Halorubrum sp. E3]